MHNAPPVVYPLGRSHFQGAALLIVWLAGMGVTAAWWAATPQVGWRLALAVVALLVAGVAAFNAWKRSPQGHLGWDGQGWRWESQGYQSGTPVSQLSVALDFQRILLLRLENQDGATLWLWATRSSMPERWMDLRRAVYSRRGALPPAARPADLTVADADFPADFFPHRPLS